MTEELKITKDDYEEYCSIVNSMKLMNINERSRDYILLLSLMDAIERYEMGIQNQEIRENGEDIQAVLPK